MSKEIKYTQDIVGEILIDHASYSSNSIVDKKRFINCIFQSSNLFNSLFVNCFFSECKIIDSEMSGCQFINCSFFGSEFSSSNFSSSRFIDCSISDDSEDLNISDCSFENALFIKNERGMNFEKCLIKNSGFKYAKFYGVDFKSVEFINCSMGEAIFNNSSIDKLDLWLNSCRGLSFIETKVERLYIPLQKLLGLIGVKDFIKENVICIENKDKIKKENENNFLILGGLKELIDSKIVIGRLFERVNSIFILSILNDGYDFEHEIKSIILNENIKDVLFNHNLDDIDFCAKQLHISEKLTSDILIYLCTKTSEILSKGFSDSISTAKCMHTLTELCQTYSTDSYNIVITHKRSNQYNILLEFFNSVKKSGEIEDLLIKNIEDGSTNLIISGGKKSSFLLIASMLALGINVELEYSSKNGIEKLKLDYNLSEKISYQSNSKGVNLSSISQDVKNILENSISGADKNKVSKIVEKASQLTKYKDFLNEINISIHKTPIQDLPVYKIIGQSISQPGAWSIIPQLNIESKWVLSN